MLEGSIMALAIDDDGALRLEERRQQELCRLQILNTRSERTFDDIVRVAALLCETPMSIIGFVDRYRLWFKAKVGVEVREAPRERSFCSYAVEQNAFCLIQDARAHPVFARHPAVISTPTVRFYAGALLKSRNECPLVPLQ